MDVCCGSCFYYKANSVMGGTNLLGKCRYPLDNLKVPATFVRDLNDFERTEHKHVVDVTDGKNCGCWKSKVTCEWCGGTDVEAVRQGNYTHFICNNKQDKCGHEWDAVLSGLDENIVLNAR